jgi:hypothetical protein
LEAWQDGLVPLKMIETGYYTKQQDKLVKKFKKP